MKVLLKDVVILNYQKKNVLNIIKLINFIPKLKFYENLLLGKNNNLHSRDLIVEELFDKKN